jgi:hypothetical protein
MQAVTVRKSKVQKPTGEQRQFKVARAFRHEGSLFLAGDIIACDEQTAERWLAVDCLAPLGGQ